MQLEDKLHPTILVIFGASGDLCWRKLGPALFSLWRNQALPHQLAVVGVGWELTSDGVLQKRLKSGIAKFSRDGKPGAKEWRDFSGELHTVRGDFKDAKTYAALARKIESIEKLWKTKANCIHYLATPPAMFVEIPNQLGRSGLARDRERVRLVVEKPFGRDQESARALNRALARHFDESQIFRIDHFLGKETVQNLLAFRFANPMFEPVWNRQYVDYVTITVAESLGVGHRSSYFEHAGTLRDMIQNHLMQLLCLVAMEPMISFNANEMRNKKLDVLRAVQRFSHDSVHEFAIRGQYGEGRIEGRKVRPYREENGVAKDSPTETYAALKLFVDNWRWMGVPFYLRTGKRLPRQASEISIHFRAMPHQVFPPETMLDWQDVRLVMLLQPDEGILLRLQAKQPGPGVHLRGVNMDFNYASAFDGTTPDAYETLLLDVIRNDPTLFMRFDQVEAAWEIIQPVLDVWSASAPVDFPNYAAGSWGPPASNALLAQSGHSWPLPSALRPKRTRRTSSRS